MGQLPVISVSRISLTPVKCFHLDHPNEVMLGRDGVAGNRRFLLVGADGKRLRSSENSWPLALSAVYHADTDCLDVRLPDGDVVSGSATGNGDVLTLRVGGRDQQVRIVRGPWEDALSELGGRALRIARVDRDGAGMVEPVTVMSSASVARLAREAGLESVDGRRFRSLFELGGCAEHEEDEWEGRRIRIGEALVEVGEPVIRCAVTTRDPDTGERDLDTLRLIRSYRGQGADGAIYFARYGRVVEPGLVRVGDGVAPV
jgi:uncharacterized protein YcbX